MLLNYASDIIRISTHAPRTGSDTASGLQQSSPTGFQPTLPARGATRRGQGVFRAAKHFNPRSPHGERRSRWEQRGAGRNFNPRSPHGERRAASKATAETWDFNPRSPHGERLRPWLLSTRATAISTHAPRTGSDVTVVWATQAEANFNPRSPHGERRFLEQPLYPADIISTHAPRTGSDMAAAV